MFGGSIAGSEKAAQEPLPELSAGISSGLMLTENGNAVSRA